MDFTREPIVETVITPKEGCKLVVRSSKSTGQEEYFVDAVEVVSFGHSFFFRSLERPKAFLVPVSDYEILEVREARMVLKNVGIDRAIKIGGGRDAQMRGQREQPQEKPEPNVQAEEYASAESSAAQPVAGETKAPDTRLDKKRDRRRHYRRRRGREEGGEGAPGEEGQEVKEGSPKIESAEPRALAEGEAAPLVQPVTTSSILTSLLPPPSTLISETIARYKDNALFRGAFYSKDEPKAVTEEEQKPVISLEQPAYGSFEVSEEEEERIYQQRKLQNARDEDEHGSPNSSEPLPENSHSDPQTVLEQENQQHIEEHLENPLQASSEPEGERVNDEQINNGNHH